MAGTTTITTCYNNDTSLVVQLDQTLRTIARLEGITPDPDPDAGVSLVTQCHNAHGNYLIMALEEARRNIARIEQAQAELTEG